MKKVVLLAAFAVAALAANAQVLKNEFLKDYKPGQQLEKGTYEEKNAPIQENTWMGAFYAQPFAGAEGPKVTKGLTYEGYPETGAAIHMSGYPTGAEKGRRFSVYSLTRNNGQYNKGVYYLAFLMNVEKLGASGFVDIVALDINYFGNNNRGKVFIGRDDNGKLKFGVGVRKTPEATEGVGGFDFRKTNLVVLKVDYDNQEVSLFVNPELTKEEPKPAATVKAAEGELKRGIKGISYNYRRNYKGAVGGFRFSNNWATAIGK